MPYNVFLFHVLFATVRKDQAPAAFRGNVLWARALPQAFLTRLFA